jgi:CubicO group peptidase (beta-lactamase class C family)
MREPSRKRPIIESEGVVSALRVLSAWIENWLAYRSQPGTVVGIVHDQELVWAQGFGLADVETGIPMGPDTLTRIASISKLFTSIAVMQLRDRGSVVLDDPVGRHLPGFPFANADTGRMKVRHLLTHTAGLPREAGFPYWCSNEFPSVEEISAKLPEQTLAHQPDTRWKYSNLGFVLAGELVAHVSGRPYTAYVEEEILKPLGLTDTTIEVPDDRRHRLAAGYSRRFPDGQRLRLPYSDTQGVAAAGGLASSVRDLARFASWLFRAGDVDPVLGRATLAEMMRVHWLRPDWKGGWGLGFSIVHREERDLVGHGGWLAGYQSVFSTSPAEKVAVIVLCNSDDSQPYLGMPDSIADRVWRWVVPEVIKAGAAAVPAPTPDPAWERLTGLYRSQWADRRVLLHNGRLAMLNPNESDPVVTMVTLQPAGEGVFRTESKAPFGEDGDPVRFEEDEAGAIRRIWVGESWADRVS